MINALLKKGGAGISISREETVTRLLPLMEQTNQLLIAYERALQVLPAEVGQELDQAAWFLRADAAKFAEQIHAQGGAAPTGLQYDPEDMDLGHSARDTFNALIERERTYRDAVQEEYADKNHRIRVLATLENALTNTNKRLSLLNQHLDALRRRG